MTRIILPLLALTLTLLSNQANAQSAATLYQAAPDDWRAETIPFPLEFAPSIELEGVEELRFAPGMFDADSDTYFTYTLLWWLDGQPDINNARLEGDLVEYFRGLYNAVSKNENKDVSNFAAYVVDSVSSDDGSDAKRYYRGTVEWVDPFVTEQELVLRFTASQWRCTDTGHTAVFFTFSPQPYDAPVWSTMAQIRAGHC